MFLSGRVLPSTPVRIDAGAFVFDLNKFFTTHLEIARSQIGRKGATPYIRRMMQVKQLIESNGNKN